MCHHSGETVDHLLIHCEKAYLLCFVFRSFTILWVLPKRVLDLFFGQRNWLGKLSFDIWNLTLLCLMWCITRERNNCTFEDVESSGNQLFAMFIGTLFDWSQVWRLTSSDLLQMFIDFFFMYTVFCSFLFVISGCFISFCMKQSFFGKILLIKKKKKIVCYDA